MEIANRLEEMLRENGVWADVYSWNNGESIIVEISWGDWKHEHWKAKELMSEEGWECYGSQTTEEDDSDTYSARHFFKRREA